MSFTDEHKTETYCSLISVSLEGLKTLLLINGGAVVAVLAYLGQSPLGARLAPHVWWPLGSFVAGVGLCALAFLFAYATQFALYNESVFPSTYKGPRHMTFLTVTVGLVLLSFVAFAVGAYSTVNVLAQHAAP
jgi:hypothetical protein